MDGRATTVGLLRDNIRAVRQRIAEACGRAGRDPADVLLVAVTKTRPAEEILAAYRCGLRHFGENRIEELEAKLRALRGHMDEPPAVWHMVGHVQSRKAGRVAATCDVVHSLDSLRLAGRLERTCGESGRRLAVLVEVNVSGEGTKYGYPAWSAETRRATVEELAGLEGLAHLDVRGLMTMAPLGAPEGELRRVFGALRALRDDLRATLPFSDWAELSMGMTDDFEVAIEEGATMVRIGRAIFGPRNE